MRKTPATTTATTTLLALCLAATWAAATDTTPYDFRHTTWGMSQEQVIAAEKTEPAKETENTLAYPIKIQGKNYLLMYLFVNDKLAKSAYTLLDNFTNKADYMVEYEKIKNLLVKLYGTPADDGKNWKDDTYRDNPERWAMAIAKGELEYRAEWQTDKTAISSNIYGNNYDINLIIAYESKELSSLFREQQEQESLNQL
jgi:hypothetical protein